MYTCIALPVLHVYETLIMYIHVYILLQLPVVVEHELPQLKQAFKAAQADYK